MQKPLWTTTILAAAVVFSCGSVALAQKTDAGKSLPHPHNHPPKDEQIHSKFYSSWMRKDTKTGCCNDNDCYPTAARYINGHWWARRREDGKWLRIPEKIYDENDPNEVRSPDGRPHLCAPNPQNTHWEPDTVLCFTPGTGT